jgi:hypothetical protein
MPYSLAIIDLDGTLPTAFRGFGARLCQLPLKA